MPEIRGSDVLLRINLGTSGSPNWSTVGSQTGVKFVDTADLVDVSSKESRARKLLSGRYQSKVSLDGLFVPGQVEYQNIKSAVRNGTQAQVRRRYASNDTEEADCIIVSCSENFPDMAPATISVEIEITGVWRAL